MSEDALIVRYLGRQDYQEVWNRMREFTDNRDKDTKDELWLLEHEPVFTLGQNGKPEHILNAGDIPVIQVDRGGQVTYHGPGQLVAYVLIDLRRHKMGIRQLVTGLENSVVGFLQHHNITAAAKPDAPGVYVDGAKIASIGLRVRRGCSYHGLAFNINMSLEPFSRINPCGFKGLEMVQVSELGGPEDVSQVAHELTEEMLAILGYNRGIHLTKWCENGQ